MDIAGISMLPLETREEYFAQASFPPMAAT
jgi:hypothetical protein